MRWAGPALVVLLLATGCAEVTRRPPPPPPAGLVGTATDPTRAALEAAAVAFADRGIALAGRPAEAAQALAQLEYVAATLPHASRYAQVSDGIGRELALARSEARDALGVAETADSMTVVNALLAAAEALRAGNRAAAAEALPAPLFRPGGAGSVARLGELGPLPQTAIATDLAAQAVARVDALSIAGPTRLPETSLGLGSHTTTFGGALGVGY